MNWLVAIAEFVVNEILAVPAYLIGIITAVGLIALRKVHAARLSAGPSSGWLISLIRSSRE